MWVMEERGMAAAAAAAVAEDEEMKRRRWVVRIKWPDFKGGNETASSWSCSMSTFERRLHSTSFGRRTGRPLLVTEAGGKKLLLPI